MNRRLQKKRKAVRKFVRFKGDAAIYQICCSCADYCAANYTLEGFRAVLNKNQDVYCRMCGKKFVGPKMVYRSSLSIIDIYAGVTLGSVLESLNVEP